MVVAKKSPTTLSEPAVPSWLLVMLDKNAKSLRTLRMHKCWRKGSEHCFYARPLDVLARGRDRACPMCTMEVASDSNSVAATAPKVALEWRSSAKNLPHVPSPSETKRTSRAAVWFKCQKHGHDFRAIIADRCQGEPCPYCAGKVTDASLRNILGSDCLDYFWDCHPKNPNIENVLASSHVTIYLRDPLTGHRFTTTPSDVVDVAKNSTYSNPKEAIYAFFIPRQDRAKALSLLKSATDNALTLVFESLLRDILLGLGLSSDDVSSASRPRRRSSQQRGLFIGGGRGGKQRRSTTSNNGEDNQNNITTTSQNPTPTPMAAVPTTDPSPAAADDPRSRRRLGSSPSVDATLELEQAPPVAAVPTAPPLQAQEKVDAQPISSRTCILL